jgi:hypothetical protein
MLYFSESFIEARSSVGYVLYTGLTTLTLRLISFLLKTVYSPTEHHLSLLKLASNYTENSTDVFQIEDENNRRTLSFTGSTGRFHC